MILTIWTYPNNRDYNALHYNYRNTFHVEGPSPILQVEVRGLTRQIKKVNANKWKIFEELEKKIDEINKPTSEEKVIKSLKLVKYSRYNKKN